MDSEDNLTEKMGFMRRGRGMQAQSVGRCVCWKEEKAF
jgi:hypothetical protein